MKKFLALSLMLIICLSTLFSCKAFEDFKSLYDNISVSGEESLVLVQDFISDFFAENYDNALRKTHKSSMISKENLEKMRSNLITHNCLTAVDSSTPLNFTKFALDSTPIMNETGELVHTQHTVIFKVEVKSIIITAFAIVLQDDFGFGIYTFRIN